MLDHRHRRVHIDQPSHHTGVEEQRDHHDGERRDNSSHKARADVGFPISSVLCVPQSNRSLISVGKLCDDGDIDEANFNRIRCLLYKSGRVIATGTRRNGLYELDREIQRHEINSVSASMDIWHQRLAHCPLQVLKVIVNKRLADGIEVDSDTTSMINKCEACETGKATRLTFQRRDPDRK